MPDRLFRFEHRSQPILHPFGFYWRVAGNMLIGAVFVIASLAIGIAGYMGFEGQELLDAFLSAAMILGGMGPVSPVVTPAGKLFAGIYALYSGLVLIYTAGILLAPIAHRILHRFHMETEALDDDGIGAGRARPR
jgi:hypothetical protein